MSEEKHQKYVDFIDELFDNLIDKHGFNSDPELAKWIGEPKGNISQYRKGKRLMNDWTLLRICEDGGFSIHYTLDMILFKKSLKKDAVEGILRLKELLTKSKKDEG